MHADLETQALEGIRAMLRAVGETPEREGLRDTPKRVLNALREMTQGARTDPAQHLEVSFDLTDVDTDLTRYDEMILSSALPFTSLCEHHLLAFSGEAHIAYIPGSSGHVVGLSKLARVLEGFAQRLQVQERLTVQIADALERALEPAGVAVLIAAQHSCQACRGIRKSGTMITVQTRGRLREWNARTEFLRLTRCGF
jgi:GTP cyclohydrolase IA